MCSQSEDKKGLASSEAQNDEKALGLHHIKAKDYVQLLNELANKVIESRGFIVLLCGVNGGTNITELNWKNLEVLITHPILMKDGALHPIILLSLGMLLTRGKVSDKAELLTEMLQENEDHPIVQRAAFQKFLEGEVVIAFVCIPALASLESFPDITEKAREEIRVWCETMAISLFNNESTLPRDQVKTQLSKEFRFCFKFEELKTAYRRNRAVD